MKLFETRLDSPNIKRIVLCKDKETGYCLTFDHFYVFKGLLGCGAFGVVVKAINRETNEECAVKVSSDYFRLLTKIISAMKRMSL